MQRVHHFGPIEQASCGQGLAEQRFEGIELAVQEREQFWNVLFDLGRRDRPKGGQALPHQQGSRNRGTAVHRMGPGLPLFHLKSESGVVQPRAGSRPRATRLWRARSLARAVVLAS